jgi:hypothetical protein
MPALGVYPNLLGLLLQAGLILVIASVFIYTYHSAEETEKPQPHVGNR